MKTGKQLNVYIDKKIYDDFRHYCAKREMKMNKAIEEMIVGYMLDYNKCYSEELKKKRNEIGNQIYKLLQQLVKETYKSEITVEQ